MPRPRAPIPAMISAAMLKEAGATLCHPRPFRAPGAIMARATTWSGPRRRAAWAAGLSRGGLRRRDPGRARGRANTWTSSARQLAGSVPERATGARRWSSPTSRSGRSAPARSRRSTRSVRCMVHLRAELTAASGRRSVGGAAALRRFGQARQRGGDIRRRGCRWRAGRRRQPEGRRFRPDRRGAGGGLRRGVPAPRFDRSRPGPRSRPTGPRGAVAMEGRHEDCNQRLRHRRTGAGLGPAPAGPRACALRGRRRAEAGGYVVDFWGAGYDVAEHGPDAGAGARRLRRPANCATSPPRAALASKVDTQVFQGLTGGRYLSLPRSAISARLIEACDGIPIRFGTSVTGSRIGRTASGLPLSDGTSAEADLLIGADGLHSAVRGAAFGPQKPNSSGSSACMSRRSNWRATGRATNWST